MFILITGRSIERTKWQCVLAAHKNFGLSKKAYYQILTGERNQTNFAFSNIRFDSAIIGIDDFLEEVEVEDNSYQTYTEWSSAMKDTIGSPFDQSYQDPRTNCFTYNTKYNRSISLYTLKVKFNIPKFQQLFEWLSFNLSRKN